MDVFFRSVPVLLIFPTLAALAWILFLRWEQPPAIAATTCSCEVPSYIVVMRASRR